MARYSIDGQILTDVADAIRAKSSVYEPEQEPVIVMSENVLVNENGRPYMEEPITKDSFMTVVTIPGAKNIKVKYLYVGYSSDAFYIAAGDHSDKNAIYEVKQYNSSAGTWDVNGYSEYIVENTDTITFYTNNRAGGKYGFYAECYKQVAVEGIAPEDMANTINNINSLNPAVLNWSGNLDSRFRNDATKFLLDLYPDSITTSNVTSLTSFMQNSTLKSLPFEINCNPALGVPLLFFCNSAEYLTEVPTINNITVGQRQDMFKDCRRLREIPDDYGKDWNWHVLDNAKNNYDYDSSGMFENCYSLRRIPAEQLKHGNPVVGYSGTVWNSLAYNCYSLDELTNIPCPHTTYYNNTSTYSQPFKDIVSGCGRLKNFTFAPMEPREWANQIIDLTSNVGWLNTTYVSYVTSYYNSGITADKRVTDFATYEALANDPDWFSTDVGYSRYNRASAVRTINSLPDCSEYASLRGANIIKFKGDAGSKTSLTWVNGKPLDSQNGAIKNLTDEEIAVAAAKGWTVTLA